MKDKILHWILDVDEENIVKRTTLWNFITSAINAGYSAILMFLIGRFIGMDEVGIFSLASAYAYQCQTIGAFGVRNVQASDVKKEFSFSDYFNLRVLSSVVMYGMLVYYAFFQGYTYEKMAIVFLFGVFKSVEAIEDLYHGEYHRYNRLDIGSILQAIRFIVSLVVFTLLLITTNDLILSFAISTVLTIIICFVENKPLIKIYVKEKLHFSFPKVKHLLLICLPICISNGISTYIVNLPKYTIDNLSLDSMQTIYGILVLPVVTINMLSVVIYRPVINQLSREYYDYNFKAFYKELLKQAMIIGVLTIIVILGGYIIGLRLLEIIYNTPLMGQMGPFIVMLIGGGVNTLASFLTVVLTIQRSQNYLLISYAITLLFGLVIANPMITQYGMMGTALLYLLLSLCMAIIFIFLVIWSSAKHKKNREEGIE